MELAAASPAPIAPAVAAAVNAAAPVTIKAATEETAKTSKGHNSRRIARVAKKPSKLGASRADEGQ